MKCIYCGKEAEYIAHGNSVCDEHLNMISTGLVDSTKEFRKYLKKLGKW